MTPTDALSLLDRFLAERGTPVTLSRRVAGTIVSVACQAFQRHYRPSELIGPIVQGDSEVTLSATEIGAAGWPGPQPPNAPDIRVPVKGDVILLSGIPRAVQGASPSYLNGVLVRLDVQVRG